MATFTLIYGINIYMCIKILLFLYNLQYVFDTIQQKWYKREKRKRRRRRRNNNRNWKQYAEMQCIIIYIYTYSYHPPVPLVMYTHTYRYTHCTHLVVIDIYKWPEAISFHPHIRYTHTSIWMNIYIFFSMLRSVV